MVGFGDFGPLCRNAPSYPWCIFFYKQLQRKSSNLVQLLPPARAPVGVEVKCGIPPVGSNGSLGNIANVIVCALSIFVTAFLIFQVSRRKAAVGRAELRLLLVFYLLTLPLQLISTGSLLQQGTTPLVVITAIHAGFVAALFFLLVGNAFVSTQIVEDGTPASLVPLGLGTLALLAGTIYVSLDTSLGFTSTLGDPAGDLRSIALFVLINIWPGVATLVSAGLLTYIIVIVLNERRPLLYYIFSLLLFILAQLARFLLGRVICDASKAKVDSSFIGTLLETASVFALVLGWKSITEESWDEDAYYP